jgi:hypothetical protein
MRLPLRKEVFMTGDNGNGMKVVGAIILFSIALFTISLIVTYFGDAWRNSPMDSAAVPVSSTH